jgi:hypothetical protein
MPASDNYATEIAALQAGLATGEARIESDGDMIWYRSVADILKGIDYFTRLAASTSLTRPSSTVAVFDPK